MGHCLQIYHHTARGTRAVTTLKELRLQTYKNLQILEERRAKQGGSPDLKLINEIEDHRRALELIDRALGQDLTPAGLKELKEALRPLLIAANVESINLNTLRIETPRQPYEPETALIPAGSFLMGSPPGENIPPEETPQHEVILPDYRLGLFPVTHAQYAEFIKRNPQQDAPKRAGWFLREPPAAKLNHPVIGVSWFDALAYCRWLSQATGRTYRLPTEAEWEKAASWTGQDKRVYPWGDTWQPAYCNTGSDETTPVSAYPEGVSAYGCYDLAGNTQEWVSTLWGNSLNESDYPYPYQANDGREDLTADHRLHRVFRLHRGGAFRDPVLNLRCTARGLSDPDSKLRWRGFRVVLET